MIRAALADVAGSGRIDSGHSPPVKRNHRVPSCRSAAARPASSRRPVSTTRMPAAVNCSAIAAPIPLVARLLPRQLSHYHLPWWSPFSHLGGKSASRAPMSQVHDLRQTARTCVTAVWVYGSSVILLIGLKGAASCWPSR